MGRKSSALIGVLAVISALFAGCATMSDVMKSKNDGTSQVYPVDSEQAWEISRTVFRWEGADTIEEHKADGYMLTSSGMNLVSMGAVMGAWIDSIDKNNSKVTVVTKRRIATNLATTLTETTFHKRFAQAVDIVKKGQRLPTASPD